MKKRGGKKGRGAKDKKQSIGGRMAGLFGMTQKKPEPDDLPGMNTARPGKLSKRRRERLASKPI